MILPVFYLTDPENINTTVEADANESLQFVFRFNSMGGFSPSETLIEKLFALHYPFCLLVEWNINMPVDNDDGLDKLIDAIIAISFHYKYISYKADTPFFIFNDQSGNFIDYIDLLESRFTAQGFRGIAYVIIKNERLYVNKSGQPNWTSFTLLRPQNDLSKTYYDLLLSPDPFSHLVVAEGASLAELGQLANEMAAAEKDLQSNFPQTYFLLSKITGMHRKQEQDMQQIKALTEKVESANQYITLHDLTDNEYRKKILGIVEFYNYEYEILPLWYKKLGHIIKVLMGKRTFKSLFNDNVKKYKI
jgi:hypothetical protein